MNVLLLEDRGSASFLLEEWLHQHRHSVLPAFNPADAQTVWGRRAIVPVDCILLDLFVPMDGLGPEEQEKAEGGFLSGWVWLEGSVLATEPGMRDRVIVYSEYIAILTAHVPAERYRGIPLVSKRRRSGSSAEIVTHFERIAGLPRLQGAGPEHKLGGTQ